MKFLIVPYQFTELMIGLLLFIPLFIVYYVLQGESISFMNILLTTLFLGILIFIKNIIVNYYIMVQQNSVQNRYPNIN